MQASHQDNIRDILLDTVTTSYANNSALYRYLETKADLATIVTYLYWDSQQPVFKDYIARWLPKTPDYLLGELETHIQEELEHADLFERMMEKLMARVAIDKNLDEKKLQYLNYTFTKDCAENESFGFFCGGFFATELMASRRYDQLIVGLDRCGIPRSDIEFIVIHSHCEPTHSIQALDDLLLPLIAADPGARSEVLRGVDDRLQRSGEYLKWYESEKLGL